MTLKHVMGFLSKKVSEIGYRKTNIDHLFSLPRRSLAEAGLFFILIPCRAEAQL
jgi:hypothetical protein